MNASSQEYHNLVVSNRAVSQALGQESHVNQIWVGGIYPSAAAFSRALIAAKLASGSEKAVGRMVRTYGSMGLAYPGTFEPGELCVSPLNGGAWRSLEEVRR